MLVGEVGIRKGVLVLFLSFLGFFGGLGGVWAGFGSPFCKNGRHRHRAKNRNYENPASAQILSVKSTLTN